MTVNFLRVYRHFGEDANKKLLGSVVCRGEEYFFEYDPDYLLSKPNPLLSFFNLVPEYSKRKTVAFLLFYSIVFLMAGDDF